MSNLIDAANDISSNKEVKKKKKVYLSLDYFDAMKILTVKDSPVPCDFKIPEGLDVDTLVLDCVLPEDCRGLFKGIKAKTITIQPSHFNSSLVKYASGMFEESNLDRVDLTGWDFSSLEVADEMFYKCSNLVIVTMSDKEFPKLKSASAMFFGCKSLSLAEVDGVKMPVVMRVDSMFGECGELITCNTSSWEIYRGAMKIGLFSGCNSLQRKYLSDWAQEELCWT